MRRIERTGQFKRDYKRELKGRHRATLESTLVDVLMRLINNQPLAEKHRDHLLAGDWLDHRDCHIKPDLVMIYRTPNDDVLQLVRLGSHSKLGL
jgi:mRNA interferase YafQ